MVATEKRVHGELYDDVDVAFFVLTLIYLSCVLFLPPPKPQANFYPMNAGMALREKSATANSKGLKQIMVLNDHPMACASLISDGKGSSMEFMIARSLRQVSLKMF